MPLSGRDLFIIRGFLVGFMVGLLISGVTAFPLPPEVAFLAGRLGIQDGVDPSHYSGLTAFIATVHHALDVTAVHSPFLFYGTDWLAFGHIVIALAFLGPLKDPVRNEWVLQWAVIACVLVVPLALICGPIRGIPFAWTLLDCSFGMVGIVPLLICLRLIRRHDLSTK
jgi:hypothetical protein